MNAAIIALFSTLMCNVSQSHIVCDANGSCFDGPPPPIVPYGPVALTQDAVNEISATLTATLSFNNRTLALSSTGNVLSAPSTEGQDVEVSITDAATGEVWDAGSAGGPDASLGYSQIVPLTGGSSDHSALSVDCFLR